MSTNPIFFSGAVLIVLASKRKKSVGVHPKAENGVPLPVHLDVSIGFHPKISSSPGDDPPSTGTYPNFSHIFSHAKMSSFHKLSKLVR